MNSYWWLKLPLERPLVRALIFVSRLDTRLAYIAELKHYQVAWVKACHGETMGDFRSLRVSKGSALYQEEVRASLRWLADFLMKQQPLYDTAKGTCELPEGPFDLIVHVGE